MPHLGVNSSILLIIILRWYFVIDYFILNVFLLDPCLSTALVSPGLVSSVHRPARVSLRRLAEVRGAEDGLSQRVTLTLASQHITWSVNNNTGITDLVNLSIRV